MKKLLCAALLTCCVYMPATADDKVKLVDELSSYLEFVDYGGGTIFAEQIPKSEYDKMLIIDARDAGQYAKDHIPNAINIEWRQVTTKDITDNTVNRRPECHGELNECRCKSIDDPK